MRGLEHLSYEDMQPTINQYSQVLRPEKQEVRWRNWAVINKELLCLDSVAKQRELQSNEMLRLWVHLNSLGEVW